MNMYIQSPKAGQHTDLGQINGFPHVSRPQFLTEGRKGANIYFTTQWV